MSLRVEAAPQTPGGGTPLGGVPTARNRNIATTFFGGAAPYVQCSQDAHDRAQGVSMLADGRVLIAGNTVCQDFNTQYPAAAGQFAANGGGSDGYVAILSSNLTHVDQWTYLPGVSTERAYLAMQDSQGNIWVTGFTQSGTGFAQGNTLLSTIGPGGGWDVFVAKFDASLTKLWAVRFGGSGEDNPRASITVVDEGQPPVPVAYVSGHTASSNFKDTRTGQFAQGCVWDAFLVKINSSGGLAWSRVFGCNDYEDAYANVRVHADGQSVYIGGFTKSTDLATKYPGLGGYNTTHNGQAATCTSCPASLSGCTSGDGFIARFDTAGNLLRWTYLGGSGNDQVSGNDGLELMPGTNQVVVIGNTESPTWTFAQPSPLRLDDTHNGLIDAYVAILSEDLSTLEFQTFFGGDGPDEPGGLAVDDVGNIYFGGNTCSDQAGVAFPLTGSAYDETYGGDGNGDAFLAKINVNLAAIPPTASLAYSTYLGGGSLHELGCGGACSGSNANNPTVCPGFEGDRVRSLMLMPNGRVLCSGDTDTDDFPTYPTSGANKVVKELYVGGDSDGFVAIHNAN